jgi:hypothetical protein
MIFHNSLASGPHLLLLRIHLVEWSNRTGIEHYTTIEQNEYRVYLPNAQHYAQFALQWEHEKFYIHTEKSSAKKFQ